MVKPLLQTAITCVIRIMESRERNIAYILLVDLVNLGNVS